GDGRATLTAPSVPAFSPLICYEVAFPGHVVAREGPRPDWILNLSNDAWFGRSAGPYQHFALARLRAVEEGRPLIRSTSTGISAIIDAAGRVLERTGLDEAGAITAALPAALRTPTLYSRWKDVPFFGVCILFLVVSILGAPRRPASWQAALDDAPNQG
ncbi:MAG: apolipoprotein N-acyltransferase, partial [Alphaproteobacteria bacterium]